MSESASNYQPGRTKIYRQDPLTAIATRISLIFFPAVAIVFAVLARGQPAVAAEALFLFVVLAAAMLFFGSDMISRVEIEADKAAILAWPILGFRRQMRWSDVQELKFVTLRSPLGSSRRGVRLIARTDRAITLSTRLSDWDDLVAELRVRVPRVVAAQ